MSDCKRSCGCWNNWGVCGKSYRCACHITQAMKDSALQVLRDQQIQNRLTINATHAGGK